MIYVSDGDATSLWPRTPERCHEFSELYAIARRLSLKPVLITYRDGDRSPAMHTVVYTRPWYTNFLLTAFIVSSAPTCLTYCHGDARETRNGSFYFRTLLQISRSCSVIVAFWIVMLSDSTFYLILFSHFLFSNLLMIRCPHIDYERKASIVDLSVA